QLCQQRLEVGQLLIRPLYQMLYSQALHPVADDAGVAPGDDGYFNPGVEQGPHTGAIAGTEGFQLFAVIAHIDEAVGEHPIHIAHQQADLRRPVVLAARHRTIKGRYVLHQITPAFSRSCMLKAPSGRLSPSTTSNPLIFLVSISLTASAAIISGPTVTQLVVITLAIEV